MTRHLFLTALLTTLLVGFAGCPLGLVGSDGEEDTETEVEYRGEVKNVVGTISRRTTDIFVIVADKETVTGTSTTVFQPMNLPEAFKKDSLRVVFSGKLRVAESDIRYLGAPLELDDIRRHDQE